MTQPAHRIALGWILRYRREKCRVATAINTAEEVSDVRFKFACTRALETSRLRSHEVSGWRCTLVNWIRVHVVCAASKGVANCLKRSRSNYPCGCSETISPLSTVTIDYKWSEDVYKATFPNVRFKYAWKFLAKETKIWDNAFVLAEIRSFLSSSILLIKYSVWIFFLRVIYIYRFIIVAMQHATENEI